MSMFNPEIFRSRVSKSESGNAIVIVLVVLVVVAVGALAYMSSQSNKADNAPDGTAATAQSDAQPAAGEEEVAEGEPLEIEPGNPVVAKVNGEEVTRLDVFNLIQTLPPNTRQMPVEQLFPLAQEEVINARLINEKTKGVNLDDDPAVKAQLEAAKSNIVRNVYLQNQIKKKITDERLQAAYEQYKAQFPEIQEAKASHILVKEKEKAEELVKELEGGADFAELAKANSIDGTAANGGQLGYFAETEVVAPFAEAAFKLSPGEYTKKPVESEFGYHIIKLEETRQRPPAPFEQAKPFLEGQMQGAVLNELISEWRREANVERYDINGDKIEPAAGGEDAAEDAAPAE